MAEMTMIEEANGSIWWECSACQKLAKDRNLFEDRTKTCPSCGAAIGRFNYLYDEDGEYT